MQSHYEIAHRQYVVLAVSALDDKYVQVTPALDFLREMARAGTYSGHAVGFKKLFERYADMGRNGLTAEIFHEVDKENSIWEFVKGPLRVFCFVDGNKVILTHGAIKKTQKVDRQEVGRAVGMRNSYFGK